ncbi:MAG: hypothetical protein MJH09_11390 [Cetobacterium sp.]|nr:hypothetical protein [Cetobacterium sp.]
MIIQYILIPIILLIILISGVIKPLFSYFNKDEILKFNGVLYENLNRKKYQKIMLAILLNFIIFLLILFLFFKIKIVSSSYVFFIIIGIMFLQKNILKPLKENKEF